MAATRVQRDLAAGQRPDAAFDLLRDAIGLTEADFAKATGASRRTIRRWASDGPPLNSSYAERLDDLRAIVSMLAPALPEHVILGWLRARNTLLDYERPLDTLGRAEFERVLSAADALLSGSFV